MRVLALVLATLLLAMPLAAGQSNNSTADENQTTTMQENGTDGTDQADGGEDTNVTLPDRSGHIPWTGLAVGLIVFAAAVLVSRVTYHGRE